MATDRCVEKCRFNQASDVVLIGSNHNVIAYSIWSSLTRRGDGCFCFCCSLFSLSLSLHFHFLFAFAAPKRKVITLLSVVVFRCSKLSNTFFACTAKSQIGWATASHRCRARRRRRSSLSDSSVIATFVKTETLCVWQTKQKMVDVNDECGWW